MRGLPGLLEGGDFDFDAHSRIEQVRRNHHGRRTNLSEVLAQHWPAFLKFLGVRNDVGYANHVFESATSLEQCGFDVLQALFRLRPNSVSDRHRRVIETCRARNEDPVALDYSSGIADFLLEG